MPDENGSYPGYIPKWCQSRETMNAGGERREAGIELYPSLDHPRRPKIEAIDVQLRKVKKYKARLRKERELWVMDALGV